MPPFRPALIASMLICFALAACSTSLPPAPTLASTPSVPPTASATAVATATRLPSATVTLPPTATFTPITTPLPPLPAALSTPVLRPANAISPANSQSLRELARWGKGRAEMVEYSPDGRWLVVKTAEGSYVYPAQNPTGPQGQYLEGSLSFAAQGQSAVTVRMDGQIELWQVAGWKRVTGWTGSQALFSVDGKWLAVADDKSVRLVQAEDGKDVRSMAFARTDHLIFDDEDGVLVASNPQTVQAWQVSDGKPLKTLDYARVLRLVMDAENGLLLVQARTQENDAVVEIYRSADWTQAASLPVSGALVIDSGEGRLFAYSNFPTPGKIEIYSLPDGQPDGEMRAGGSIYRLAVSPDGKTLAASIVDFSASNQQTVGYLKTFDTKGKELKRLDCGIFCEAQMPVFSPDSKLLAVTGASSANGVYVGSVFFFNPLTGERVRTLRGPKAVPGVVARVAFAPDGLNLVTLTGRVDDAVRIWKAADGALLATLEWGPETLSLGELSANGSSLASYSDAGLMRIQSVQDGTVASQIDKLTDPHLSPRGEWVAAAGINNGRLEALRLVQATNGVLITSFPATFSGSLAFSPVEDLGALCKDFSIQLVKLPGGGFGGTLNASGKPNIHLTVSAFSPDGKLIAAGSANGEIWVWRVAERKQLFILEGHKINVTSLIFSRDGARLLSGSSDGAVKVWSLADGSLSQSINTTDLVRGFAATEDASFGQLASLAQAPDGSLLAVSGTLNPLQPSPARAGVTLLINLSAGSLLRMLPGGGGNAAFAADSKILYTSGDGAVHQWGVMP
jgi:WD40 repeat protein